MKKENLKDTGGAMGVSSFYTQAAKAGNILYLAGIGGFDSDRHKIIMSFDDIPDEECKKLRTGDWHYDEIQEQIMAQTWWTYMQMKKVLEAAGSSLNDIMQTIIFIQDIRKNFAPFDRVRKMFVQDPPPSTILEVTRLGISDELLVEISAIAIIPDDK